ncbi:MAG TPA: hypothetical protein VK503_10560 [Candidatus Bathyarchaeia archaeon]|nr:hypothetical protein [Candidatus Bathyarchaeia archaeon]
MKTAQVKSAIQSKSLTTLTKAISELADELAYRLTPPNTEITQFLAKEHDSGYLVHFSASLRLCYSSLSMAEGIIFVVDFDGDAISEEPTPSIHELFYAAIVRAITIYAYGGKWSGRPIATPPELSHLLDLKSSTIMILSLDDFYKQSGLE